MDLIGRKEKLINRLTDELNRMIILYEDNNQMDCQLLEEIKLKVRLIEVQKNKLEKLLKEKR